MPVINLLRTTRDEGLYELLLAKRGKRAGATHLEGDRTCLLHLKHSDHSILWEQRPKPIVVVEEPKPKKTKKTKKTKEEIAEGRSKAASKDLKFLDVLCLHRSHLTFHFHHHLHHHVQLILFWRWHCFRPSASEG